LFPVPDTDFMYKISSGHDDPHRYNGVYQYFINTWLLTLGMLSMNVRCIHSLIHVDGTGRNPVDGLIYDGHVCWIRKLNIMLLLLIVEKQDDELLFFLTLMT
jgi:hypothetical protein